MHFVHIFLLLFKFKGRGKFVPLVYILSSLLVALIYAGLHSQCRFNPRYEVRLLCVGSLFLAGMINPHLTKNPITPDSENDLQEEGQYIYISVSSWTKIFFALGVIALLLTIADMMKR